MNRTLNWLKDRLSAFWLISDDRDELIAELAEVKQQLRIAEDALSIAHEEWAIEREKLVKANEMYQRQHDRLLRRVHSIRQYATGKEQSATARFEELENRHRSLVSLISNAVSPTGPGKVEDLDLWSKDIGDINAVFPESEDDMGTIPC